MRFKQFFLLSSFVVALHANADDVTSLFRDLETVHQIETRANDALPFFYNQSLLGGYFLMPSARMAREGSVALGGGHVYPYNIYGGNVQLYRRLELSGGYRTFKGGVTSFLSRDSDRIVNAKFALLMPGDCFEWLPKVSIGVQDFVGSNRSGAEYVVATKEFTGANFEVSLGWGRRQIQGVFGGAAWTPLRKTCIPILRHVTLQAEYDATDEKKSVTNVRRFWKRGKRMNAGVSYLLGETLQVTAFSHRGENIGALASIRYPLGSSCGLFPKTSNPPFFEKSLECSPLEEELISAFACQRIPISTLSRFCEGAAKPSLLLRLVNPTYRRACEVKERIDHVLAALMTSEYESVVVVIEADGIPSTAYSYRVQDLLAFQVGEMSPFQLCSRTPLVEATFPDNVQCLYRRSVTPPSFLLRPRVLTFFGAREGTFKYTAGLLAAMEGHFSSGIYYYVQAGYQAVSSDPSSLSVSSTLKPPSLPEVRTDALHYYEQATVTLEQAYLQKGWNLSQGWYTRLAGGYFEPAFGGGALEFLYYPVGSCFGVGVEGALMAKRRYTGLKFASHTRQIRHGKVERVSFLGKQAFLNLYATICPLATDLEFNIGRFVGEDIGVRSALSKQFKSGFRFSIWYTLSRNQHSFDHFYHDRGFAFSVPLDFFMKKSSRASVGYSLAAQLRNNGVRVNTGKRLYETLREERR